jgi:hypothetical protein
MSLTDEGDEHCAIRNWPISDKSGIGRPGVRNKEHTEVLPTSLMLESCVFKFVNRD